MMKYEMKLSPRLTSQILSYIGCVRKKPSVRYLNQLIYAYVRHVPWESVSRIIKRETTAEIQDCPRWPAEFWQDALAYGTGGTCFENNLAFLTVLKELGFEGYLTINDMENTACHTANIITLNQQKYLVDVAIPIHCALPLYVDQITRRSNEFHFYSIRPERKCRYAVERSHHPKRRAFTLVDIPVPFEEYRIAVQNDYKETGYFLDRVIIIKVIRDRLWRFSSLDFPFKLEGFDKTSREEVLLEKDGLAKSLSGHFGMDEEKIAAALAYRKVI